MGQVAIRRKNEPREAGVTDYARAKYVQLRESDGNFYIVLLDSERQELGFGYKGPTLKRAQQDLKYWTRDKGLDEVSG
jgi:hypothetical protein